jgi:hypothetical protein
MLKPRRLPSLPIPLAHPLEPGSRGVFVAPADVAFDHLGQLITEFVKKEDMRRRGVPSPDEWDAVEDPPVSSSGG